METAYATLEAFITAYPEPTFEEMLRLCVAFGLVSDYEGGMFGVRLTCAGEVYELGVDEAEAMMRGLLIGFFHGHERDNLTLSCWVG